MARTPSALTAMVALWHAAVEAHHFLLAYPRANEGAASPMDEHTLSRRQVAVVQLAVETIVEGVLHWRGGGGAGGAGGAAAASGRSQGVQQAGGRGSGGGGGSNSAGGSASFWERGWGWEDEEGTEASVRARLEAEAVAVELPRLMAEALRGSVSAPGHCREGAGAGAAAACGHCFTEILTPVHMVLTWCPLTVGIFIRAGGFRALAQLEGMAPRLLLAQLASTCVTLWGANTDPRTPDGSRCFFEPMGPGQGTVGPLLAMHGWAVGQMAEGGLLPVLRRCVASSADTGTPAFRHGGAWCGPPPPSHCSWHHRTSAWTWLGPCAMLRPDAVAGPPLLPAGEMGPALLAKAAADDLGAAEREMTACWDPSKWHELGQWTPRLHDEVGQASGEVWRDAVWCGMVWRGVVWCGDAVCHLSIRQWGASAPSSCGRGCHP